MSPIINSKIDIEVKKEHPFLGILKKILYPVSLELRKFSSKNLRIREKNFGNPGSRTPSVSPFEAKNFILYFTREAINKKWPWCWWNSLFHVFYTFISQSIKGRFKSPYTGDILAPTRCDQKHRFMSTF